MCDPVAAVAVRFVVDRLADCVRYLPASDVKQFMNTNVKPPPSLDNLVLSVQIDCAVSGLTDNRTINEMAMALYGVISHTPHLKLSSNYSGNQEQATSKIANLLRGILSEASVQSCVTRFNAGQPILIKQGNYATLSRPMNCQLNDIARCLICPEVLSTIYVVDPMGMPTSGGPRNKGNGDMNWLWIIILIIIVVLVLYLIFRKK